jgi:regulator of replication initiation timing
MTTRLETIYNKIKHIIEANQRLESEMKTLKSELNSVQTKQNEAVKELEVLKVEKENLENKLNFYTLAPESLNKRAIKEKIDQYISEIDLCIKQLENI